MALRIRELPWYLQSVLFLGIAAGVVLAGELLPIPVPGLDVKELSDQRKQRETDRGRLRGEVSQLELVQKHHRDLKGRIEALERQVLASEAIIPRSKQTDAFMRDIQGGATNSQVAIRRITAKPVVIEQNYAQMPVEIELDGSYFNLLEFYDRLARLTRVVNATDLKLDGIEAKGRGAQKKYEYAPGTSVAGTCVLTTYYTPSEAEIAAAAPAGPAGRAPARPGAAPGTQPPRPPTTPAR